MPRLSRTAPAISKSLILLALTIAAMISCSRKPAEQLSYVSYIDTTLAVYGPYNIVKLPITNGIGISSPIQVSLGPDSLIYVSNQTGEVYSLIDSDGDGLDDMAITRNDGKVLIGRVVNSNENRISLIMVGNHVVDIPRSVILKAEDQKKSLMYEGLLNSLSEDEKESLLTYLVSLSQQTQ